MLLWTPNGYVDLEAHKIHRAVNQYDERLYFDFVPEFQSWSVFIKMPHGTPSVIVLKFGPTLPDKDHVMKTLWEIDGYRDGDGIFERSLAEAKKLYNQDSPEVEDAKWEFAEAAEAYSRNQGRTRYSKSFSKAIESKRTGGKD